MPEKLLWLLIPALACRAKPGLARPERRARAFPMSWQTVLGGKCDSPRYNSGAGCARWAHRARMPDRKPVVEKHDAAAKSIERDGAVVCCACLDHDHPCFLAVREREREAAARRGSVRARLPAVYVAEENHLFEQRMREQGLAPVPVEIVHVAGGPPINDGLLSGNFELGSGGYTAMMVSWDKTRNAGNSRLLGVTALSSVPYDLFSTDAQLTSVKDLNRERDKIGVPSVKVSVPAIYLQMEAERLFGPGKHTALDDLTVRCRSPTARSRSSPAAPP